MEIDSRPAKETIQNKPQNLSPKLASRKIVQIVTRFLQPIFLTEKNYTTP